MSSYLDMSLNDIIMKKKGEEARAKRRQQRFRLNKLRHERATVPGPLRKTFPRTGIFTRAPPATEFVFADSSRQVTFQPVATATSRIGYKRHINTETFNQARSIEKPRLFEFQHRPKPRPPQIAVGRDIQMIEEEYVPQPLAMIKRKPSNGQANKVAAMHRTVVADKKNKAPQLTTIPNNLPMATLRSDIIAKKIEKPHLEYRIIVSNLNPAVTSADIQELFEDVGVMMESRLVRPGIAEVIYLTQDDAQTAVDLYHNRHLDGQPMNCLLITPRVPYTAAGSCCTKNPEFGRANLNVEMDLSTLHKRCSRGKPSDTFEHFN